MLLSLLLSLFLAAYLSRWGGAQGSPLLLLLLLLLLLVPGSELLLLLLLLLLVPGSELLLLLLLPWVLQPWPQLSRYFVSAGGDSNLSLLLQPELLAAALPEAAAAASAAVHALLLSPFILRGTAGSAAAAEMPATARGFIGVLKGLKALCLGGRADVFAAFLETCDPTLDLLQQQQPAAAVAAAAAAGRALEMQQQQQQHLLQQLHVLEARMDAAIRSLHEYEWYPAAAVAAASLIACGRGLDDSLPLLLMQLTRQSCRYREICCCCCCCCCRLCDSLSLSVHPIASLSEAAQLLHRAATRPQLYGQLLAAPRTSQQKQLLQQPLDFGPTG